MPQVVELEKTMHAQMNQPSPVEQTGSTTRVVMPSAQVTEDSVAAWGTSAPMGLGGGPRDKGNIFLWNLFHGLLVLYKYHCCVIEGT